MPGVVLCVGNICFRSGETPCFVRPIDELNKPEVRLVLPSLGGIVGYFVWVGLAWRTRGYLISVGLAQRTSARRSDGLFLFLMPEYRVITGLL